MTRAWSLFVDALCLGLALAGLLGGAFIVLGLN
jgi:hypothetical protein